MYRILPWSYIGEITKSEECKVAVQVSTKHESAEAWTMQRFQYYLVYIGLSLSFTLHVPIRQNYFKTSNR